MTAIIFLLVLAILIFVHELGHFLAARACGIRVDRFAIGFGPKLISKKVGETTYAVNVIPFGGYVKIFGEDPNSESMEGPDSERSFVNKPRWQQAIVLFAGVFFNFIFAWLLYTVIFIGGTTVSTDGFAKYSERFSDQRVMVAYVESGSPAEKAGIKAGDAIVKIGQEYEKSPEDTLAIQNIQEAINSSEGRSITLEYNRAGNIGTVEIIPIQGIVKDKYAIGIAMDKVADLKLPVLSAIVESVRYTAVITRETAIGLWSFVSNIFKGAADFSDIAGPIGIAGIIGNAADLGYVYLLMITAIISINLGVINLIPFPALDGGRILFVFVEGIIRKRIPAKFFNITNAIGFILLMMLMIFVTYGDIVKIVAK